MTLLAIFGLVVGAGPAQAGSPASVGKTKSITVPMDLQDKGDVTTNTTVTGTCGSISLDISLVGNGELDLKFGYRSTQGPVRSHNMVGVYANAPTFVIGSFGDVGFPNLAEFETTDTVDIGSPAVPTAVLTVRVLTPNGPCFGVVGDLLGN
ncbi:hypothetical protein [Amycolatopsis azurea]|uniref:Secreted protein n=1 Tax=Amycolatopsis azurea DSM 43854 TaxID=1238180 RepID=M2PUI2_9PSEU|nr:hypothetical protein [Amycolatopsis azurea]EMD28278.1 hypothetical protein C791_1277 [Amycolatopsis azurea DSM 43854]